MGRLVFSKEQMAWVRANVHRSPTEMAGYLGCHVDTLKRLLMREGLAYFPGAKYHVSRKVKEDTWTRPCSGCGSTKPRPRWQYYCQPCKTRLGHDQGTMPWDE